MFDLNKKRKLQADQFGLPISKHKCWNHRVSPKLLVILDENILVEDLSARLAKDEAEEPCIYYVSESVESAKDSNSFIGNDDFSMSERNDTKFDSDSSKLLSSTATYTLGDLSCNNTKDYQTSDGTTAGVSSAENEPVYEVADYDPSSYFDEIQLHQNLDDAILEDSGEYFGHEIGCIEPFKSLHKPLHSSKANPDVPLLSTGSCSINQDAETVRKPTIDQEFEQYFSMLML